MCMPPMVRYGCMPAPMPMYHHCCFSPIAVKDDVKMLEEYKQRLQSEIEGIDRRIAELKKK